MRTRLIDTECGPVEYSEAGTGDPILYFHGTGVTGELMIEVELRLIDAGFRLVVPNRPGYGKTPLSPHLTAADCGKVAAALLDALGIHSVSVMGSSGGAAFALSFALSHPMRTQSLVLLCPQVHRWDHKRWLPRTSRWTMPLLERPWLRTLLLTLYRMQLGRLTIPRFLETEAGDRYPEVARDPAALHLSEVTLKAMVQSANSAGFENDFKVFLGEDISVPNSALLTPTLVIYDVADPLAPVDHVNWLAACFPKCERVSLHAGGHLVWVGRDAETMHQTRERFLREHTGSVA